jgi:hypothetical protein
MRNVENLLGSVPLRLRMLYAAAHVPGGAALIAAMRG